MLDVFVDVNVPKESVVVQCRRTRFVVFRGLFGVELKIAGSYQAKNPRMICWFRFARSMFYSGHPCSALNSNMTARLYHSL